jgi:hypothetical protein
MMMNQDLASMLSMGAHLARELGATSEEIATTVEVSEDYLMDLRRQVANLHADVAEMEIRLRNLEQVSPRANGNGKNGNGGPR